MKKICTLLFMIIFAFAFTNARSSQKISPKKINKIKPEIDSIFQVMVSYAEKLYYDSLQFGVDDTRHAGFIIDNTYYSTYDSMISSITSNIGSAKSQQITIEKKIITVLSNRLALLTTTGQSTLTLYSDTSFTYNFYWSFVYEKINGNWKVIHSHQSIKR